MNSQDICLALDLGGTKLLIGEVDAQGQVLNSRRYSSCILNNAGQEDALAGVMIALDDYMASHIKNAVSCIGMGMVGRVDNRQGQWLEIDPRRCTTVPVVRLLSERFHLPCAIDNDVRCALRAERELDWGKKTNNYIYINVGTGIAAGIVTGGHVITGASYNAGEVGHHVVNLSDGTECCCGRIGCVEAIASGMGMDNRARLLAPQYPDTRLYFPSDRRCATEDIFQLCQGGDRLCMRVVEDAADALAALIMNLIWVSDPDTVILGGGVLSSGLMYQRILQKLLPNAIRFVKNGIVLTKLNPGLIGLIGAGLTGIDARRNGQIKA